MLQRVWHSLKEYDDGYVRLTEPTGLVRVLSPHGTIGAMMVHQPWRLAERVAYCTVIRSELTGSLSVKANSQRGERLAAPGETTPFTATRTRGCGVIGRSTGQIELLYHPFSWRPLVRSPYPPCLVFRLARGGLATIRQASVLHEVTPDEVRHM